MPAAARVAVLACATALAHGIKDAFGRREGQVQRLNDCASSLRGAAMTTTTTTTPEPYAEWWSDGVLRETPPPTNAYDSRTDAAPLWARTPSTRHATALAPPDRPPPIPLCDKLERNMLKARGAHARAPLFPANPARNATRRFAPNDRRGLAQLWKSMRDNPACLMVYLQSGALLGWYRDGGPLAVDSDLDVQGTINEDRGAGCKRELFWEWVMPSNLQPTEVAVNLYHEWRDPESGLTERHSDARGFARMRRRLCLRAVDQSVPPEGPVMFPTPLYPLIEDMVQRTYGPAWFVPLPMHGLKYYHGEFMFAGGGYEEPLVKTIRAIASAKDGTVTAADIDRYMARKGVAATAYAARVSPVQRCRAAKWMNWIAAYQRDPGRFAIDEALEPAECQRHCLLGKSHLFRFSECEATPHGPNVDGDQDKALAWWRPRTPGYPIKTCIVAEEDDESKVLACGDGQVIQAVTFASYGTPSGRCSGGGDSSHSFKRGKCHAARSREMLESQCVGKAHCALIAANHAFGGEPCLGVQKRVAVAVTCGQQNGTANANEKRSSIPP